MPTPKTIYEAVVDWPTRQPEDFVQIEAGNNRWKIAEVGGLWAAALVGIIAIVVASNDASEQRGALLDQVKTIKTQATTNIALLRGTISPPLFGLAAIFPDRIEKIDGPGLANTSGIIGFRLIPTVINTGGTDAQEVAMRWSLIRVPGGPSDRKKAHCPQPMNDADEPDQGTISSHMTGNLSSLDLSIDDAKKASGLQSSLNLFAVGTAEYKDIFGNAGRNNIHHIYWCSIIVPADVERAFFNPPRPLVNISD